MHHVNIDDSDSEPEPKRAHQSAVAESADAPAAVAGLPAAEGPANAPLAVASGSVPPPPKGRYHDFAVHGIRSGSEVTAVAKNACMVALQRRDRPAVVLPGMVSLAVPDTKFTEFPWVQWPVFMYSESVLSVERRSGKTWVSLGSAELMNTSAACPAAYVVEVKLRPEHFVATMPLTLTIGIIVAGGRMKSQNVWDEAQSAVAGCTVVFVSSRGGGEFPEQEYGRLPVFARNMFPNIAVAEQDLVIYHIENQDGCKFRGKLETKKYPVVWMYCMHGPSGTSNDKGRKGKGKGRKGNDKGTASSSRGGGTADHKGEDTDSSRGGGKQGHKCKDTGTVSSSRGGGKVGRKD
jgi:hypothetical protein